MRRSSIVLAGVSALAVAAIPSGAHAATFVFASGNYVPGATSPSPLLSPDVLSISGGSNKFFNGVTFTNQSGTVNWSGGALFFSNAAVINNQSLWDTSFDGSLNYNGGAASTFSNSGIFRKSAGTGTTTIGAVGFVNSGIIDAQTGTISFTGGDARFNAGSSFTGAGVVAINSASTFNGAFSSANLAFRSGSYTGNAAALTGSADWSAGTFVGGWTLTGGSTLTATGGSNRFLNAANITNDGTISWQEASALFFTNGSQLTNNGTIDYAASSSLNNNGGALSTVTNSATGLVRVASGTALGVNNSFVNDGGTITANGTVNFNAGNAVFNTGTTFNGTGFNEINASAAFNGAISTTNLRFNGGTSTGTGASLNGQAIWTAGTLSGDWTLASGSTLTATSGSNRFLNAATVTNDGVIDWQQASALFMGNGSELVNNGTIDYNASSSLNSNGGAASTVTNSASGLIRVATGTALGVNDRLVNDGGTITANGTVNFNAGNAVFNSGTIFNGAGFNEVNSSAAFSGAISASNLRFNGGTATGTGATLSGDAIWTAGTFSGDWALTGGSTLTATGGSNRFLNAASFTNNGTIDWQQASALFFTSGSELVNNGTIAYAASSSLNNNGGAVSTVTNSATGVIEVDAGTALNVGNRFVNDGGTITANGTVSFNAGNAVFNTGTSFEGTGINAINSDAAFNGSISSTNVSFNGGTFTGTGAVLAGDAAWTAGTFAGGWALASGSTLAATGGSNRFIAGATFTNGGTIEWRQASALFLGNGAQLVNSGTIDYQVDASVNYNGGATTAFTNNGLIEKTGGTGTTRLSDTGVTFDNNGTINVLSGTVALPGAFTNDGTLGGTGRFTSTNLVNAGAIAPGAPGATGSLLLAGNFSQAASGQLRTQLASSSSADLFNISGTAVLGGTLSLSCIMGCAINDGDSFVILDSVGALSGTFANITTTGFLNGFSYDVQYDYDADLVRLTVLDAGNAPAVPEPASWAMMIAGFALAGMGARRRRTNIVCA